MENIVNHISQEDLKKIQDFKNQSDMKLHSLKLEIENISLQFQNVILRTHVKYKITQEQYVDLETGEILQKKKEEEEENVK